ncbi:hypothetical protein D3C73_831140 [compost metagenome]
MQDQRLHGFVAVLQKAALMLDDLGGNLHQGFIAALQALDEPAGLLQLIAHEGIVGAGVGAAHETGVLGIDPQPWHRLLIELHQPALVVLAHDDVRNDVLGFGGLDLRARARVEALDQLDDLAQLIFLELHATHQLAVVAAAKQVDVIGDQALGLGQPRGLGRQLAQLQQQAFAQVAGADAGGLELLDAVQDGFDFVQFDVQFRVEGFEDFLEGFVQVALIVDAVDQGHGDQAIGVGHRGQVQLPQQVALQAFAGRGAGGEVPLVIIIAGQAAGAGLVNVFPRGVDGEFIGDALVPVTLIEVVNRRGAFLVGGFLDIGVGLLFGVVGQGVGIVEVVAFFLAFEHRIGLQGLLDFLLQIQGRQLEQADGLLQLRCHRQLLAHSQD